MNTVALTMRVTDANGYHEPRDSISHDWLNKLHGWGMRPALMPNAKADAVEIFDESNADLLILTGGEDIGVAPERDSTERLLLAQALARGTPVLGVCRGLQLINCEFGGRLGRVEGHVAADHSVKIADAWALYYGAEVTVNSFHKIAIPNDGLGEGLEAMAWDEADNIEALRHETKPLAAVMWHPERPGGHDGDLQLIQSLLRNAKSST